MLPHRPTRPGVNLGAGAAARWPLRPAHLVWTLLSVALAPPARLAGAQPAAPSAPLLCVAPAAASMPAPAPDTPPTPGPVGAATPTLAPPVAPRLAIGDRAPALGPAVWLNGAAVPRFRKGTVYLVEFWATWCFPCRQSLPHLNQLQQTYRRRGLQVLGVAAHESGSSAGLTQFLARNHLDYPVAYVAENAPTAPTWGWRARPNGIPLAFVVDRRGRIVWWGEPRGDAFDDAVKRAVAG